MIVLPDGKVCRNLPEQVAENLKKIQEIIHFLDGVNIQDNLVVIADLSQILTQAELEIVERPVAFIYYNAELYIKKNEAAGVAYFINIFSIEDTGTQLNFNSNEIQVNLGTGALAYTAATESSYTKDQIDSLLALKADLSGATFTGDVVAKTLSQVQPTYEATATIAPITGFTKLAEYVKLVIVNNIIHIVISGTFRNDSGSSQNFGFGSILFQNIPTDIGSKIIDAGGSDLTTVPDGVNFWKRILRIVPSGYTITGIGSGIVRCEISHGATNGIAIYNGVITSVPSTNIITTTMEANLIIF